MKATTKKSNREGKIIKKGVSYVIVLLLAIASIVGVVKYLDAKEYSFWRTNELRLIYEFKITDDETVDSILDQKVENRKNASAKILKRIEELKKGMIKFLNETYKVDVSSKMEKLKTVYTYTQDEYKGQELYGYVDAKENSVNINAKILDKKNVLNAVIIHEIFHYLGIKNDKGIVYVMEGITEALTYRCLEFLKMNTTATNAYEMFKKLGLQILVVDPEIVIQLLEDENFEVVDRIDERLKDIKQPYTDEKDIGQNLECCCGTLFRGTADNGNEDLYVIQAQNIVASYAKTFSPTKEQIKEIRKYYIIDNFEKIKVNIIGEKVFVDFGD